MAHTTPTTPTIERILPTFFDEQTALVTGLARDRIVEVAESLARCVEMHGEEVLVDDDRAHLAAERVFDEHYRVARLAHADDLIYVLAIFVDPSWLPQHPSDLRAHLRMVERLVKWITRRRLVYWDEVNCALYDIDARVRQARAALISGGAEAHRP